MGSEYTGQEEAPATVPRLAILLVENDPGIVSALLQVCRRFVAITGDILSPGLKAFAMQSGVSQLTNPSA
jgi:hypothetical protein